MGHPLFSLPGSLLREVRARVVWQFYSHLGPPLARLQRKRLNHIDFIGITGTAGKTTSKLLTTAIVATAGQVREWKGSGNVVHMTERVMRGTRTSDDFSVVEISAGEGPGFIDQQIALVRPQIGVVTSIGIEHLSMYRSIDAIAAEKSKLIKALPADGIAVLNADDPLVLAMGDGFAGQIITYGVATDATLRAENVSAPWPDRLSFTAFYDGQSCHVQTQLCGTHWVPSVLSALAAGVAVGIPLETAARAVSTVEPFRARMEPVETSNGVTFIRDDWKAPLWAMPTALNFLETATAPRKIMVVGNLSDYPGAAPPVYKRIALRALEVADYVFFVGPQSAHALAAKPDDDDQSLRIFSNTKQVSDFLDEFLRPGDLVVLKGSPRVEHLGRIALHRIAPISCWTMDCGKLELCDSCPLLRADVEKGAPAALPAQTPAQPETALPQLEAPFSVVVGFGNPGAQYRHSPHNIGFEVLDILAARLGLTWTDLNNAAVAYGPTDGQQILLVKPLTNVNNTSKVIQPLSEAMGFTPKDVVLIQDDIALPLGKLRTRTKGSDGGHKGVLSLLLAYQTNEFRRVKIGVKLPDSGDQAKYLTSPLPAAIRPTIDIACEEAADRVLELVRIR